MDLKMSSKQVDVDVMLAHAGDFNKYQYILIVIFAIINILSSFHYFGQTFLNISPPTACFKEEQNITYTNNTIDITFKQNYTCWEKMHGYISISEELGWYGEKSWIPVLGQSMYFAGAIIGSLILGILADRIGRLHILVAANMLAFIGNLLTLFANETIFYTFSRFIAGLATDCNFVMMYIIVMEYLRPSMRTTGLNLTIGIFYCLGCVAVPWIAVAAKTWRYFLLVITIPILLVLGCYLIVPESAQWLLSKGRINEAVTCFEKIAKMNNRKLSDELIQNFKTYSQKYESNSNARFDFLGLFKTPKLRRKICILILKSMIITLCYDAIARDVNNLNYSPFILFSLTSVTIFPACVVIYLLQDRIGRKSMASGSLLLSACFIFGVSVIIASYDTLDSRITIVTMAVARLGINIAYNSSHQYAVELIPTQVRGQGVSLVHVAGYAASFFSSQLLHLAVYWKPIPEILLGILLLIGALACLALPETLNQTLPVTLEDGEQFGENDTCCQFYCCNNRVAVEE